MILKELKIQTWIGDPTNCYIIFDEKSKETMVIDPAGDVDKIQEMINILGGKLKYIYITHCHGDHIVGVSKLKEKCGITIVQGMKGYDVFSLSKMNILSLNCVKNLHEFMRIKNNIVHRQTVMYSRNSSFRRFWEYILLS